jgi:chromosome segregation ATPase
MSGNKNNIERRLTNVEEVILLLTQKALHMDDRADEFDTNLSNLTTKIEALTDAQIRTEDALARLSAAQERLAESQARTDEALARLSESQHRTDEAMARLAESQAHSDRRLDALIDIVRNGRNSGGGGDNPKA